MEELSEIVLELCAMQNRVPPETASLCENFVSSFVCFCCWLLRLLVDIYNFCVGGDELTQSTNPTLTPEY
jgi:hypothetical protein